MTPTIIKILLIITSWLISGIIGARIVIKHTRVKPTFKGYIIYALFGLVALFVAIDISMNEIKK